MSLKDLLESIERVRLESPPEALELAEKALGLARNSPPRAQAKDEPIHVELLSIAHSGEIRSAILSVENDLDP